MKKISAKSRRERGQSMVELALTAPVLILLLIGLVEVGHAYNSYLTVLNAARDGARLGAQTGVDTAEKQTQIKNLISKETERLSPTIPQACSGDEAGMCITTSASGCPAPAAKCLDVKVCRDHPLMLGIPLLFDGPIRMCSHTTIRIAI